MTIVSRTQFQTDTDTLYPDNTSGQISPADLRAQMDNIADSVAFRSVGYTAAPTANDDSAGNGGNGEFNVGDFWVDETNDNAYICVDDTATSAVWELIGGPLILSQTGSASATQIATWASGSEIQGDNSLTWVGNNRLVLTASVPIIELTDSNATVNNRRWQFWSDDTNFKMQALTDAGVAGDRFLQLNRTNDDIINLEFYQSGTARSTLVPNGLNFAGANSTIQSTDTTDLILGTNSTARLTFDGNSFVSTFASDTGDAVVVEVGDSNLTTGPAIITVGANRAGNGPSRLDFVSDQTYTTYGLRIIRNAGDTGASTITHLGTGELGIYTNQAATIRFVTDSSTALTIDGSTQNVNINEALTVGGLTTLNGDFTISSNAPLVTLSDADAANNGIATITAGPAGEITFSADPNDVEASSYITYFVDGTEMVRINDSGNVDLANDGYVIATTQVNAQTGTAYTLPLSSTNGIVTMDNANANTLTIDPVATTAYPLGYTVEVIQLGAGTTTIQAGAGVTLNGVTAGGGDITAQYDVVKLRHVASDVWIVSGDIGAIA